MDRILHSSFYTLHHSIYLKTNVPRPQLRAMPLFYQWNGYKRGRLPQTTFTIPQCFFQCMLNLAKTVCFSCHIIKHKSRGVFSWIYAPQRTSRMDPISFITWTLDGRENPCSSCSYLWDYQLYIKTSFALFYLSIMSFAISFVSAAQRLEVCFVQLKQQLYARTDPLFHLPRR